MSNNMHHHEHGHNHGSGKACCHGKGALEAGDMNLVEHWVKIDPRRIGAGILGGVFAGVVMLLFAMMLAKSAGMDTFFPAKLPALPFLGNAALDLGNSSAVALGIIVHLALCGFLGAVYSHFSITQKVLPLLGIGLTWGIFGWIFINNLFTPSFRDVFVAHIPSGVSFIVHLVFGAALVSVGFFDKLLRGAKS